MNGCGNNFAIYDFVNRELLLEDIFSRSVGCDQILLIKNSDKADFLMQIYNSDGSEAGACGNGARCVAFIASRKLGRNKVTLETKSRIIHAEVISPDKVAVNMGPALLRGENYVGESGYRVDMGNDHLVVFSDQYDRILVEVKKNPLFFNGINVNFARIIDKGQLALRTHERGVGFTESCGSGACASFAVAHKLGYCDKNLRVIQDGGALQISFDAEDNIIMTGPVAIGHK